MNTTTCLVDDCSRSHRARGFCNRHYRRWRRWGTPTGGTPGTNRPIEERLGESSNVDENGCWVWVGTVSPNTGYGVISIGPRPQQASIASDYGVHQSTVSLIATGKSWGSK